MGNVNHIMEEKELIISYADKSDAYQISLLEKECFSMPWSEASLIESIEKDYSVFIKAVQDEKIVGYVGMYKTYEEGDITNIAVLRKYRNQGIGIKLLEYLFCECRKQKITSIMLEVRKSNATAVRLYARAGFIHIGERKNFYEKPVEDAIIMKKELAE